MGKADRIAKASAKDAAVDRVRDERQADVEEARNRSLMLDEGETLIGPAVELLERNRISSVVSFKVQRRLARGFVGNRGGWLLGDVLGGLGHGEVGPIPLYLLTTGEFVYGGDPSTTSAVGTLKLDCFSKNQLPRVIYLLRKVIAEGQGSSEARVPDWCEPVFAGTVRSFAARRAREEREYYSVGEATTGLLRCLNALR